MMASRWMAAAAVVVGVAAAASCAEAACETAGPETPTFVSGDLTSSRLRLRFSVSSRYVSRPHFDLPQTVCDSHVGVDYWTFEEAAPGSCAPLAVTAEFPSELALNSCNFGFSLDAAGRTVASTQIGVTTVEQQLDAQGNPVQVFGEPVTTTRTTYIKVEAPLEEAVDPVFSFP